MHASLIVFERERDADWDVKDKRDGVREQLDCLNYTTMTVMNMSEGSF